MNSVLFKITVDQYTYSIEPSDDTDMAENCLWIVVADGRVWRGQFLLEIIDNSFNWNYCEQHHISEMDILIPQKIRFIIDRALKLKAFL